LQIFKTISTHVPYLLIICYGIVTLSNWNAVLFLRFWQFASSFDYIIAIIVSCHIMYINMQIYLKYSHKLVHILTVKNQDFGTFNMFAVLTSWWLRAIEPIEAYTICHIRQKLLQQRQIFYYKAKNWVVIARLAIP